MQLTSEHERLKAKCAQLEAEIQRNDTTELREEMRAVMAERDQMRKQMEDADASWRDKLQQLQGELQAEKQRQEHGECPRFCVRACACVCVCRAGLSWATHAHQPSRFTEKEQLSKDFEEKKQKLRADFKTHRERAREAIQDKDQTIAALQQQLQVPAAGVTTSTPTC